MPLALQLSNHGWYSHKLLISGLIMFQQFRQMHQGIFAIFREALREHIEYCNLSWIRKAEAKEFSLTNVAIDWVIFFRKFFKQLAVYLQAHNWFYLVDPLFWIFLLFFVCLEICFALYIHGCNLLGPYKFVYSLVLPFWLE